MMRFATWKVVTILLGTLVAALIVLPSLLSPEHMIETPAGFPTKAHLRLGMNDIVDPAAGTAPPWDRWIRPSRSNTSRSRRTVMSEIPISRATSATETKPRSAIRRCSAVRRAPAGATGMAALPDGGAKLALSSISQL